MSEFPFSFAYIKAKTGKSNIFSRREKFINAIYFISLGWGMLGKKGGVEDFTLAIWSNCLSKETQKNSVVFSYEEYWGALSILYSNYLLNESWNGPIQRSKSRFNFYDNFDKNYIDYESVKIIYDIGLDDGQYIMSNDITLTVKRRDERSNNLRDLLNKTEIFQDFPKV